MSQRSCNRNRKPGRPAACFTEPEVRRWPHPIDVPCRRDQPDPALHYLHCALSYQNQLLSEIKTLLERLCVEREDTP